MGELPEIEGVYQVIVPKLGRDSHTRCHPARHSLLSASNKETSKAQDGLVDGLNSVGRSSCLHRSRGAG